MGKKGKGHKPQATKPTPGAEPEVGKVGETDELSQLVASLSPELQEKAMAQIAKLKAQTERSEHAKAFVAFDNALKDELEGLIPFIASLAEAHGVNLQGRRITITYPAEGGKPAYTNAPKGKGGGGGNGSREGTGFTSHGKVLYEDKEHNSLHALALTLGLQYEGRRTAFQVFEEPLELGTKNPLPYKFSVNRNGEGKLVVEMIEAES